MKKLLLMSLTAATLIVVAADASARGRGWGHHGHRGHGGHFSLHLGGPGWWGAPRYYAPRPYYYYEPRTVIIERQPPVYIQRQPEIVTQAPAAPTAPTAPTIWYYCPEPAGYYPHVPTCPTQWVQVDPRTVAPPPGR